MSLELLIYLAGVADSLNVLIGLPAILGAIALIMFAMAKTFDGSWDEKTTKNYLLSCFVVFSLCVISALLPSSKTIYSIAAIKMGKEISKNEKVIETSDKVYKLLNQKLDEMLEVKK